MLCIHAGGGAAEPRDPHDGADLHAEFVRADRFGDHHSAQKGLAVRPGQVSALSVRAVVLWLSGPDHPVLCLQPCGAGRCDDPEQNFPYLGHHSGRHLYERKAAQDPDPGAGTFHGGCLYRVPPQL